MITMNIFVLVGILALWTYLPSAAGLPPLEKMGTCPPDPFRCSVPGVNACSFDMDCPGIKKCCYFSCALTCRNPQDKPGNCPILPFICSIPGVDTCSHDYDCTEYKKCCHINCAKTCVDP